MRLAHILERKDVVRLHFLAERDVLCLERLALRRVRRLGRRECRRVLLREARYSRRVLCAQLLERFVVLCTQPLDRRRVLRTERPGVHRVCIGCLDARRVWVALDCMQRLDRQRVIKSFVLERRVLWHGRLRERSVALVREVVKHRLVLCVAERQQVRALVEQDRQRLELAWNPTLLVFRQARQLGVDPPPDERLCRCRPVHGGKHDAWDASVTCDTSTLCTATRGAPRSRRGRQRRTGARSGPWTCAARA